VGAGPVTGVFPPVPTQPGGTSVAATGSLCAGGTSAVVRETAGHPPAGAYACGCLLWPEWAPRSGE
jgi:hypothetical protein